MNKLRVGIASAGRFHLLDLARELDALGVEVKFYSYVPRKRTEKFGLPRRCHVGLLSFLFPLVAISQWLPRLLPRTVERLTSWALDYWVILLMRPCDVFICMSGIYLQAPRFAKWRYGARIFLHRGSMHILAQRQILEDVPGAMQVSEFMVRRELEGYALADRIAVPASHVVDSFSNWPELSRKLELMPYGVDLDSFPLVIGAKPSEPTILFVGNWSFQKGVDILTKAVRAMEGVRLWHVGALADAPFPDDPCFIHHEPVSQEHLVEFYAAAHVFVLASRQEGLALVQCQALASGLPLVCTDRTGGADLARLAGLSRLVRVVPPDDPDALREALEGTLTDAMTDTGMAQISKAERESLSWTAYAQRHLKSLLSAK